MSNSRAPDHVGNHSHSRTSFWGMSIFSFARGQGSQSWARFKNGALGFSSGSRRALSNYRNHRRARDSVISQRSRIGLDLTNFFLADVQVGFGSFLAFYLAQLGWSKQTVGIALTVGSLTALLSQLPGGALADAVSWKRGLAAIGIVT